MRSDARPVTSCSQTRPRAAVLAVLSGRVLPECRAAGRLGWWSLWAAAPPVAADDFPEFGGVRVGSHAAPSSAFAAPVALRRACDRVSAGAAQAETAPSRPRERPSRGTASGAGIGPRLGVARLLALRPMRIVGDRSYAFYLWHWPVLILADAYAGHELSVSAKLGLTGRGSRGGIRSFGNG